MPLAVKSLPSDADIEIVATEDRLAQFIRIEVDRAVRDIERRTRLADAELEHRARRASKRIVTAGHRLEKSIRIRPMPILPIAIGLTLIGAAILLSYRPRKSAWKTPEM